MAYPKPPDPSVLPGRPNRYELEIAEAQKSLRTLLTRYDMAEFRAQQHASDMVDIVAGFARDPTLDPKFRKECAIDVMNRAYGTVTQKTQVTMIGQVAADDPVARDIAKATEQAAAYRRLSEYIDAVPYADWPDDVKVLAGDMGAAFDIQPATVEHEGPVTEIVVDAPAPPG